MKKTLIKMLSAGALLMVLFSSCETPTTPTTTPTPTTPTTTTTTPTTADPVDDPVDDRVDDPVTDPTVGSNSTLVISGTIEVANSGYWSNLKIGLFSGGSTGTYGGSLGTEMLTSASAKEGRLAYYNNATADTVNDLALQQVADSTFSVTGSGETTRTYTFELPSAAPGVSTTYYYAAWLDSDADGALDVKNVSKVFSPDIVATGEFNRVAWKDAKYNDDVATILKINGFQQMYDYTTSTYTGTYKYSGSDMDSYSEIREVKTGANSTGFNFKMIPVNTSENSIAITGW